jgi:putative PIN family toxin of toxin-antitoxin system
MARNLRQAEVFIDANTLISGLFFEGPESVLLTLGVMGRVKLVTCSFVLEEVREVVRRKFPSAISKFDDMMTVVTVLKTENDGHARKLIRDGKDVPVLATALKHKPDYFVTGDDDFHTPEIKKLLNVVRTQEFLKEIFDK